MSSYAPDIVDKNRIEKKGLEQFIETEIHTDVDLSTYDEWKGMPEYVQEDKEAFQVIRVRFDRLEDVLDFGKKIGQNVTDKTKALWYPKKEHSLTEWVDE